MLLQPAAASCNLQTANEIANEKSLDLPTTPIPECAVTLDPKAKGPCCTRGYFPGGIAGRLRCTPRQQGTSHKELAARAARSDLGANTHTRDPVAPA